MINTGGSAGVVSQKSYHNNKGPPLFFVMMRLNIKVVLFFFCVAALFTFLNLWTRCGLSHTDRLLRIRQDDNLEEGDDEDRGGRAQQGAEEIDCVINGDYSIGCRKEGDEVYVPFSFLHKYFEIYGKLATYDGLERFEWSHSVGKIYHPKGKYDPRGVFMHFENFNVEARDRVKCVSALTGVPISTQWESQGYHYPTQIAQFGLAHYSKNLTEPEPRRKLVEDGGDRESAKWIAPSGSSVTRNYDAASTSRVLNFSTTDAFSSGVKLKMDHVLDFVMSLNLALCANSSLTVVLQNREKKEYYNLHYIASDILITAQNENIYHGIGTSEGWRRVTRDLIIDLQKGLNFLERDKSKHNSRLPRAKLKIVGVVLRGRGALDNLTLSTSEHILQFYDAAEWFVKNQDEKTGGWTIPVKRKLAAGFQDLEPGWYSSMGQGQAVSVLSRAYHHSGGDTRYLNAAVHALKPFRVPSWQGGVLATFLNKFHWYEEYPTRPASFVLNGFIYSLLGLYDLLTVAPDERAQRDARLLFDEGIASLKNMLMLYDMGATTAYDLRHLTLGIAPNLARWDYHVTHINQLLLLSTIDSDPIFQRTAERWIGYMSGKRAAHN